MSALVPYSQSCNPFLIGFFFSLPKSGASLFNARAFAPFVFLGKLSGAILGMALWGVGMGTQESVMRAAISDMTPKDKRGTAFGIFNTGYGIAWFLGSVTMGFLYDRSVQSVIIFSVASQLLAVPLFYAVSQKKETS